MADVLVFCYVLSRVGLLDSDSDSRRRGWGLTGVILPHMLSPSLSLALALLLSCSPALLLSARCSLSLAFLLRSSAWGLTVPQVLGEVLDAGGDAPLRLVQVRAP